MFKFGSPGHAAVLRELYQLLTREPCTGMLVQVSINEMKLLGNVLRKLTLSSVRFIVVGVKKQLC